MNKIFTYTARPRLYPAPYLSQYRHQLHKESKAADSQKLSGVLAALATLGILAIVYLAGH